MGEAAPNSVLTNEVAVHYLLRGEDQAFRQVYALLRIEHVSISTSPHICIFSCISLTMRAISFNGYETTFV